MNSQLVRIACVLALTGVLSACMELGIGSATGLVQWCGPSLCSWQTDSGTIKRVKTWSKHDHGISLEGIGTRISLLSEAGPIKCLQMSVHVDADPEAALSLLLDFNDDGQIEYEHEVPAGDWKWSFFRLTPPVDYRSVRYIVSKQGAGRAVLDQVKVQEVADSGWGNPCKDDPPLLLNDGATCTVDESCSSGLCASGRCSSCGVARGSTQACANGLGCHASEQCASGACVGGVCQTCALDGSCAALTNCDSEVQCQSGACVQRLTLSNVTEATTCLHCTSNGECGRGGTCTNGVCERCAFDPMPRQCAECTDDSQCPSGNCVFGVCGGCRTSEQCPSGETCRFTDRFDVGPRVCTAEVVTGLPRGALCEASEECADGLACGAGRDEPSRCGVACGSDPSVCGDSGVCTRAGLAERDGIVFFPQLLKPAFANFGARVATCYSLITVIQDEGAPCSLHAECVSGACCDGTCGDSRYQSPNQRSSECTFSHGF